MTEREQSLQDKWTVDPPDPDNIGWNYHIYRSHTHGVFVADIGGFRYDSKHRNFAEFRYVKGKGFFVQDSHGATFHLTGDAVGAMQHIMEQR